MVGEYEVHLPSSFYRDYAAIRSDAFVEINYQKSEFVTALEYDRTVKSSKRYFRKIKDYYRNKDITGIIYFCETKAIMNKLLSIDKKVCGKDESKFFFSLSDNILSEDQEVILLNSKGQKFKLI